MSGFDRIPQYVLDARQAIEENKDAAEKQIDRNGCSYWGGYYDACRHALKAIPPHLVYPDPEDLVLDPEDRR